MSKVINLEQFKNVKELQEYCNKQYETLSKLNTENEQLRAKVEHLEKILSGTNTPIASNELELCKLEISRLYDAALAGPLTDQETRKFDILVKNLLAIQGKEPEKKVSKKKEPQKTREELIALALEAMPETDEQ